MNVTITQETNSRLKITFPYNEKIVSAMRQVPSRWYHHKDRYWTIPSNQESVNSLLENLYNTGMFTAFDQKEKTVHQVTLENAAVQAGIDEMCRKLKYRIYSKSTIRSYTVQVKRFFDYTELEPASVKRHDIVLYLESLQNQLGISRTFAAHTINGLQHFYRYSYSIIDNPAENMHLPKKAQKYPDILAKSEVSRILAGVQNVKHRLLLTLVYSAGMRVSEAVKLKLDDLDFERSTIHVRQSKNRKDRYIMLAEGIRPLFEEYNDNYKLKDWLFPGQKRGSHLSVRSAQCVFERAVDGCNICKHVSIHSLRHAFATHLLEDGIDLRYIQKLLGHKSVRTTEIYTHVSTADIQKIPSPLDTL